ncbi:unnamed protein product, partial [Symbiodinium sp. CCMP2456]
LAEQLPGSLRKPARAAGGREEREGAGAFGQADYEGRSCGFRWWSAGRLSQGWRFSVQLV